MKKGLAITVVFSVLFCLVSQGSAQAKSTWVSYAHHYYSEEFTIFNVHYSGSMGAPQKVYMVVRTREAAPPHNWSSEIIGGFWCEGETYLLMWSQDYIWQMVTGPLGNPLISDIGDFSFDSDMLVFFFTDNDDGEWEGYGDGTEVSADNLYVTGILCKNDPLLHCDLAAAVFSDSDPSGVQSFELFAYSGVDFAGLLWESSVHFLSIPMAIFDSTYIYWDPAPPADPLDWGDEADLDVYSCTWPTSGDGSEGDPYTSLVHYFQDEQLAGGYDFWDNDDVQGFMPGGMLFAYIKGVYDPGDTPRTLLGFVILERACLPYGVSWSSAPLRTCAAP